MQRTRANRRIILIILSIVLIFGIVLFDQFTKKFFRDSYSVGQVKTIIDGFFYFTLSKNSGAAFSFLANKTWGQLFFKILTCIALLGFVIYLIISLKREARFLSVTLSFIIGGTIGNFIDRIVFNEVTDFLSFQFGNYYFPVFNVADSFLTVGVILLIICLLFVDKNALFKKNESTKD